ncbi:M56 family metallopeptidase [Streptomyces sp. NRRL B-24484]|uniref:M56 family metallopeptidase n=1 Tax=Streptomyces sp. NRRL B-24484 TaxID=1463833 RepID=UPI0004C23E8C|nr:M56 family metallopeptidase [Streptomyces sp. NRRL B-24484]
MNTPALAALLLPWLAAPAVRALAARLTPRWAALSVACCAALLAAGTAVGLSVLLLAGLLHLPWLAAAGRLPLAWVAATSPAAVPVAATAGLLLAAVTAAAGRALAAQRAQLATARRAVAGLAAEDGTVVVPDASAEAFALPGRPGLVVVTSGMLAALDDRERHVLVAHERAHLAGRHHVFSRAVQVAGAVHPALRGLRAPLDLHLERWADEEAARAVGDRPLTARAVARGALAAAAERRTAPRGAALPAADTGPVPVRVAALLAPAPRAPRGRLLHLVVAGLLTVVGTTAATGLGSAYDLHEYVEQGQATLPPAATADR